MRLKYFPYFFHFVSGRCFARFTRLDHLRASSEIGGKIADNHADHLRRRLEINGQTFGANNRKGGKHQTESPFNP